jgi:hypothetical protein
MVMHRGCKTRDQTIHDHHRNGRNGLHRNKTGEQNKPVPHAKLPDNDTRVFANARPMIHAGNAGRSGKPINRASQTPNSLPSRTPFPHSNS